MKNQLTSFPVNLTNSQRKAMNRSRTMQNLRTGLAQGDSIKGVFVDNYKGMSQDVVTVNTENNLFQWIITPRGRIVEERTAKVI